MTRKRMQTRTPLMAPEHPKQRPATALERQAATHNSAQKPCRAAPNPRHPTPRAPPPNASRAPRASSAALTRMPDTASGRAPDSHWSPSAPGERRHVEQGHAVCLRPSAPLLPQLSGRHPHALCHPGTPHARRRRPATPAGARAAAGRLRARERLPAVRRPTPLGPRSASGPANPSGTAAARAPRMDPTTLSLCARPFCLLAGRHRRRRRPRRRRPRKTTRRRRCRRRRRRRRPRARCLRPAAA